MWQFSVAVALAFLDELVPKILAYVELFASYILLFSNSSDTAEGQIKGDDRRMPGWWRLRT